MTEETRKLLILAFSAGYHRGHDDTVEGGFLWCEEGTKEAAEDWINDATDDGSLNPE